MRRLFVGLAIVAISAAGCGPLLQPGGPTKEPGGSVVTSTASTDGPLAAACPTLPAARKAVPSITSGPTINTTVFKTMVLQCNYRLPGLDRELHQAGLGILVFDATADGTAMCDAARGDRNFTEISDIAALTGSTDCAISATRGGQLELFVTKRGYTLHVMHTAPDGIPLDQLVALTQATLDALAGLG